MINVGKPLTNSVDAFVFYLRVRHIFDSTALTSEQFTEIEVTIIADCRQETITPFPVQPPIRYTFKDPKVSTVFPSFTSSDPVRCVPFYELLYIDPVTPSMPKLISNLAAFLTWTNSTHLVEVEYTINNQYSWKNTDNIYTVQLKGCLWGGVCSTQNTEVILVKNCEYAVFNGGSIDSQYWATSADKLKIIEQDFISPLQF